MHQMFARLALILLIFSHLVAAQAEDMEFDGVILPENATPITKGATGRSTFYGTWVGAWGGTLKHILVIERSAGDGEARVIYAYGDAPTWGIKRGWARYNAKTEKGRLTVFGNGFEATYDVLNDNLLNATFAFRSSRSQATMRRLDVDDLTTVKNIKWNNAQSVMLDTSLIENGKPVRLEAILSIPEGDGPFPLAVMNHGSTGSGKRAGLFKQTWFDPGLAEYFTSRGYLVAFPQRRGRGKSDGLYDEGFSKNRSKGYACSTRRSLAGTERALTDLDAAIQTLWKRDDVIAGKVMLGGVSRGGVLSVAFAGHHPKQVDGVVNFVGGWMSEDCKNGLIINQTLFKQAAQYQKPILSIYGEGDPFYSVDHSRSNFDVFINAGGKGRFVSVSVPGGNGHIVHVVHPLWRGALDKYLDTTLPANRD